MLINIDVLLEEIWTCVKSKCSDLSGGIVRDYNLENQQKGKCVGRAQSKFQLYNLTVQILKTFLAIVMLNLYSRFCWVFGSFITFILVYKSEGNCFLKRLNVYCLHLLPLQYPVVLCGFGWWYKFCDSWSLKLHLHHGRTLQTNVACACVNPVLLMCRSCRSTDK